MVFGRDEAGFDMSDSTIHLIVDNCKGGSPNGTDAYQFFKSISTSSSQEKEKGVLKQNDQN